jgi:predicted TIM-barrel fold metal-dependent hydrolase
MSSHSTRREAIIGLGAFSASVGLSSCGTLPISPFCPADSIISDPNTPLTIDAHAHVFNGSDLQVEGFVSYILGLDNPAFKDFGPILQELGRDFAPTANQELAQLQQLHGALFSCDNAIAFNITEALADTGYQRAATELKGALRRALARRIFTARPLSAEIARQISHLPASRHDYKVLRRRRFREAPESIAVSGAIDFIIRNFQYRYVNVHDYLFEYSIGKQRKVDLIVAHLVDFDWPIGGGCPTPTPLDEQVLVMEQIARLTNGRVHCFAPYDPLKQVAYTLGLASTSPLQLVQNAILNHGFIGVKLYPPMGFAPLLNASLGPSFWNVDWLPVGLHRSDMGARLDAALGDLYAWCRANGVPIMAHTSPTNGASPAFKALTKARYWKAVRDNFPGIRIDFGHFGDTDLVKSSQRAVALTKLMTPGQASSGRYLYADSSYFVDLLSRPETLQNTLAYLLKLTENKGDAALAHRFMYGTDWEMVTIEGPTSEQYLQRFEAIFTKLSNNPVLSNQFFGINAADFFGLRKGELNRNRLDNFFSLSANPAWMIKVDKLNVVS